jgi:hypothetical protein
MAYASGVDNIVVALEPSNRVWENQIPGRQLEKILTMMREHKVCGSGHPRFGASVLGVSALDEGLPKPF